MGTRADFATFLMMLALVQAPSLAAVPAVQKQYQLVNPGPSGFTLKLADAPVRAPGANEVLVRVRATSLNRRDIYVIDGQYPIGSRTSLVPLSDGAGEVVAVGPGTKRFRVGDRVAANFFQNWVQRKPRRGHADDRARRRARRHADGIRHAERSGPRQDSGQSQLRGSGNAALARASRRGTGSSTRGHTQAGDYVLLEGTGGVSMFGLQFAVALGAKPIITSSSDAKLDRAKALGAVGLINYKKNPEWEKSVMEITGGAGAQHILDVGGKDTLPHALASLGSGGNLALIGGLGGFGGEIPTFALMGRNASAFGIYVGSRREFRGDECLH